MCYGGNSGCLCLSRRNIFDEIGKLKRGVFDRLVVINNRYDGIDLPDESCRVLIIDSLPFFNSLSDKYEEKCRHDREIIYKKIAQKIEQGIGRGRSRNRLIYNRIFYSGVDCAGFHGFSFKDRIYP